MGRQNTPVQTPDGRFDSIKLAAEHYGVVPSLIAHRMKNYPNQYYRLIAKATYFKPDDEDESPVIYHPPVEVINLKKYWKERREQFNQNLR